MALWRRKEDTPIQVWAKKSLAMFASLVDVASQELPESAGEFDLDGKKLAQELPFVFLVLINTQLAQNFRKACTAIGDEFLPMVHQIGLGHYIVPEVLAEYQEAFYGALKNRLSPDDTAPTSDPIYCIAKVLLTRVTGSETKNAFQIQFLRSVVGDYFVRICNAIDKHF